MFMLRPILRELAVATVIQLFIAFFLLEDDTSRLVSWCVYVVYLLIPSNITFWPFGWRSTTTFKKQVEALPRSEKTWAKATKRCGPATHEQYVIVGGNGFVGTRIALALLLRGESRVRIVDLESSALNELMETYAPRLEFVRADVTKLEQIEKALDGADCVYAPFALIRYWERYQKHWPRSFKVNLDGTRNVLETCAKLGVKRVVVTSSSAAVERWPGWIEEGINETSPRCTKDNYLCNYSLSKALQEEIALAANGDNGMAVSCIRPCSAVFGYGDKLQLRIAIDKSMYPIMHPDSVVDFVHVDCIVLAHLLLEHRLRNGPEDPAAGIAFCISQNEPLPNGVFGTLVSEAALSEWGRKIPVVYLPARLLYILSIFISVADYFYWGSSLSHILGKDLGILTLPSLLQDSHNIVVKNSSLPEKLLGYKPHMSVRSSVEKVMREYAEDKAVL